MPETRNLKPETFRSKGFSSRVYLGHANVETTMIYTHVVKSMRAPAVSPLDTLRRAG